MLEIGVCMGSVFLVLKPTMSEIEAEEEADQTSRRRHDRSRSRSSRTLARCRRGTEIASGSSNPTNRYGSSVAGIRAVIDLDNGAGGSVPQDETAGSSLGAL
eukprot:7813277-Heterocapsa_arctica.AAC.1